MIYNMTGGAGGLKLYVKAYSTSSEMTADTPKENTIGVVASSVTGYKISEKSPSHTSGIVWIKLGTDNETYVDADKKSLITIHPIKASISDGSAWTSCDMQIYKDGSWHKQWHVFVQNKQRVSDYSTSGSGVTFDANGLVIKNIASSGTWCTAYKQIDITPYSKMYVKAYSNCTSAYTTITCKCGITSAINNADTWYKSADMKPSSAGTNEYEIDVSSYSGNVYAQISMRGNANTSNVRQIQVSEWRLVP